MTSGPHEARKACEKFSFCKSFHHFLIHNHYTLNLSWIIDGFHYARFFNRFVDREPDA